MFEELLQATLSLTVGASTFEAKAGSIELLELDARVYGFEARVRFRVSSEESADSLFDPFNSDPVMRATLSLANGRLTLAGEVATAAVFVGYVSERSFVETTSADLTSSPVIDRAYEVRFADAARVFWSEHRPLAVYANHSFKDVFDANQVEGVTLAYDLPAFDQAYDVLCVGTGSLARASFYDFALWLIDDCTGVIELDASTGSYRIGKDKTDPPSFNQLPGDTIAELRIVHPPRWRHATRVINPFTEAAQHTMDVANSLAGSGVRRDVVSYTPVVKEMEQRATLERDRLRQRKPHARVTFARLPELLPIPNSGLEFGEGSSPSGYCAGKSFRVIEFELRARLPDGAGGTDYGDANQRFAIDLSIELELASDPVPILPEYMLPTYPVMAEGKVLSASGAESSRTWHALAGQSDSILRYRVQVPLWNQTVVVPFAPGGESGHFFFPAYKNQRVLIAFELTGGRIVGFLDWASKLAIETQGNQLVMGKTETSSTIFKHVYTDESPVLTLVRNEAGDSQTIELSDGRFFLEVKAEESQDTGVQTYDLTPQAEVAKDAASSQARSAIADLTGSYQSSMASASSELDAASDELSQGVGAASASLAQKTAEVEAQLSSQTSELEALADDLDAQVSQAKAELTALIED
ncbi:MAG TPA: hypothetical protein VFQ61_16210 [Polyangiaceae bacterium]|nr:hypothetical protein [Polyangiaceae bacterium]